MFIIEMIIMSITANLGLIAFVAILALSALIAVKGESMLEAFTARYPEWDEDRDMNLFEIIRNRKG